MADLRTRQGFVTHDGPTDRMSRFIGLGLAVALVVVAVLRLATFGWAGIAPDDARYVFVGLSVFAGNGPVTPSGNVFLLRSPVYGAILAAGGQAFVDPIGGARIVAAGLALAGLLGAVRLGWLLAGPRAAAGTAVAILAMPLIWRLLPTLRVDLPQTAGVIAVLLAIHRPTARRWALAGVLLGLTVLVKETVLLLGALPVAAAGLLPWRVLVRLWAVYVAAAVAVASWWWVVVWAQAGVVFPANAIGVIERREVAADLRVDSYGLALLVAAVAGWAVVAWRARSEFGPRLLITAAACLVPPAAYATLNGLSSRNYAGLAVLSAVAIGVAVSTVIERVRDRPSVRRARTTARAAIVVAVVVAILAVTAAVAAVGQARVGDPAEPEIPARVTAWLRDRTATGDRVVMAFRYREITALELFGRLDVAGLTATRVDGDSSLSDYLWMGLRDRQLFGYRRETWRAALGVTGTSRLVLAGPHPLTPAELIPALNDGLFPGIREAATFAAGAEWARIYAVEPGAVLAALTWPEPRISPDAALAWLDLGPGLSQGADARRAELFAARPVLVGEGVEAVVERLAGVACALPSTQPDSGATLVPVADAVDQPGAICART